MRCDGCCTRGRMGRVQCGKGSNWASAGSRFRLAGLDFRFAVHAFISAGRRSRRTVPRSMRAVTHSSRAVSHFRRVVTHFRRVVTRIAAMCAASSIARSALRPIGTAPFGRWYRARSERYGTSLDGCRTSGDGSRTSGGRCRTSGARYCTSVDGYSTSHRRCRFHRLAFASHSGAPLCSPFISVFSAVKERRFKGSLSRGQSP